MWRNFLPPGQIINFDPNFSICTKKDFSYKITSCHYHDFQFLPNFSLPLKNAWFFVPFEFWSFPINSVNTTKSFPDLTLKNSRSVFHKRQIMWAFLTRGSWVSIFPKIYLQCVTVKVLPNARSISLEHILHLLANTFKNGKPCSV